MTESDRRMPCEHHADLIERVATKAYVSWAVGLAVTLFLLVVSVLIASISNNKADEIRVSGIERRLDRDGAANTRRLERIEEKLDALMQRKSSGR